MSHPRKKVSLLKPYTLIKVAGQGGREVWRPYIADLIKVALDTRHLRTGKLLFGGHTSKSLQ